MNCVKHGVSVGDCNVCLDMEIAEELEYTSESELQEDLENCEEFKAARRIE